MAPPVWILVLLVGPAWGKAHRPAPVWRQKPLDWKPLARSSRDSSILTQCDFEDDTKPLCSWSQESDDDGDWVRTSGPSPTGFSGPAGGYPNGEGYYLHMDPTNFRRGGVARLRSPELWDRGPLCVHFAYHMFGLSWGTQLRLLLLGTPDSRPSILWKHVNTQSPSWMPTTVTVPTDLALPSRLMFEGIRGSTAYLDISLDALSIHHGTCHRVCMMQMCDFDTLNDLCGWSWIPTATGAKWIQKKGPSGQPGVGPDNDFSSPGSGFYMLLDPKNAKPKQKSVLLSPLRQSAGCLTLSFHYTSRGQSPGAALHVFASVLGSIRKHRLFSGQPGPTWKPVSVNYTGRGQIQFSLVGMFGKIPEPALAVDEISIAPCEDSFPQCNFEDGAHPFCDWTHTSGDSGRWIWGSKNVPNSITATSGKSSYGGEHYIYLEGDKFSRPGQSITLASRPFCAPGNICVEFAYHMYGLGEGTTLRFLLGSPAGSPPIALWNRFGSQGPDWLVSSVTIPAGHQQPMQLFFEATRGSNTAFIVSLGFISINHGTCRAWTSTVPPTGPPVPPTGPSTTTVPTEKPTVPTVVTTVPSEKPTIPTEATTIPTEATTVPTERTTVSTETTTVPIEATTLPTETTTVLTEVTTVPTETTTVLTEATTLPTEATTVPTEATTVPTEETTVPTESTTVPTESTTVPTVPTEATTVPTEATTVPTEATTVPTQATTQMSTALVRSSHAPSTSMTSTVPTTTTTQRPTTVSCPPNAHHESCACPMSCENPKPSCGTFCQAGCVCNPGFLFHNKQCVNASSCDCFYNNNYYKPGEEWFSPNCTERCYCWPGRRMECRIAQCGTRTVCQLKDGQYGCHPYGTATCLVYGTLHYVTFDEKHIGFRGKCTYTVTQPCVNLTDPFFRVTAKNEERGLPGVSLLSKVYVTVSGITITLLKGKRTLVGDQQVTLPAMPSEGIFLGPSGRFVELKARFGLRVRWDGDQQLFVTVSSTFSGKLCGLCGNYDGDSSNDILKPDGNLAQNEDELGNSWQMAEDENKECQQNQGSPPSYDSASTNSMAGPNFCGRLIDSHGAFEACLLHIKASPFFDNCVSDMSDFQGLRSMLCAHMSAVTTICQDAGYAVKPWRGPQFCSLSCPHNSKYALCTKPCPDTCHSGFSVPMCQDQCVEACECNPGFFLSGLECVPKSQCGCIGPLGDYFKTGEQWYKPGCRELCVCDRNNRILCRPWKCQAQEACGGRNGIYGCHVLGSATCSASGDPHYLTFDGTLHHFMGTCTYTLTRTCWIQENSFVVSATNENRGGNLEVSYVKAVQIQVFDVKISLIKGRKVTVNNHRVALPVWPLRGRVTIRLSGSFILLYTSFGLQVRYDGKHLLMITVPSSYMGRLCGLCGNYNNNSLDDNLRPDGKPISNSSLLGASWKIEEASEFPCFLTGGKPSSCQEGNMADAWTKNCEILMNPLGPFSSCHLVVPPQASFASCVHGQCGTKGDALTLCRSLQAYAALCALAGQAPAWRNSTFCPLRCPPNSSYSPCANPCPATCRTLSSRKDCLLTLPCTEGCECQEGHILSGTSCVPLNQCGCTDEGGSYHPVGEHWYTDSTCTTGCTCSVHNNITCRRTTCKPDQMCWALDGLLHCRSSDVSGTCRVSEDSKYLSFDGTGHPLRDTCTHVLVKVCHPTMDLPFFKISANSQMSDGTFYLFRVYIDIFEFHITLQRGHQVLINGAVVTLPATSQIPGVKITSKSIYTIFTLQIGVQVTFDGSHFLEIIVPAAYYQKLCGVCGNYNGEEEDDLIMSDDELARDSQEFMDSWKDKDIDPNCHIKDVNVKCKPADLKRAQESCRAVFETSAWTDCASRVALEPFLIGCINTMCEFGGLGSVLCDSLKAFQTACQSQGLRAPHWRNSSFCSLGCPAHSTYTNCLQRCSPTCWDKDGHCKGVSTQISSTCSEGCLCKLGYVMHEDMCIRRSHCPCKDSQGGFITAGKSWISHGCTQSCTCREGTIQCRSFRCPWGFHCKETSSNSTCAPDKSDKCTVSGDAFYRTFDHVDYRFQGHMTYYLIKTVDSLPAGLQPLVVKGRNQPDRPGSVELREVIVNVYGYKVQLQEELRLVVNNQRMAIPFSPHKHLQVIRQSERLYLTTDFGLVISFDGSHDAVITLPRMYEGLVRGLCGNYDMNWDNDLMLPNGQLTPNPNVFGNSWEVKAEDTLLRFPRSLREEEEGQSGFLRTECSPEQLALINSSQACRVLVDPQGPFAACHQIVAPEPFQEHCMLDLCTAQDPKEQEELRCRVLNGYAIICQEAGTRLAGWRDHTHCAMVCPPNTVYQSCMAPCPASCANLVAPRHCDGPCIEGCASLPGYTYSSTQNLPVASCGCTTSGIYYQLGDNFVTEDCSQRCTCASPGFLLCEPFGCRAGEVCTLRNLTRGCFRESPCLQNPCHNDGRCHEQGDNFTCECELGYGGVLCMDPRAVPPRKKPEGSNSVAVLVGVMVLMMVIVPVVTKGYAYRTRRSRRWEKVQTRSRLWPSAQDTVPDSAFPDAPI